MTLLSDFFKKGYIRNRQVFTSNGSWTVPDGVEYADVIVVGGGGSGGLTNTSEHMCGGGAGAITMVKDYYVGGESSIAVSIGAGGVRKTTFGSGNQGGSSSFGDIVSIGGYGGTTSESISKSGPIEEYIYGSDGTYKNVTALWILINGRQDGTKYPISSLKTIGDNYYSITGSNGGLSGYDGMPNLGGLGGTGTTYFGGGAGGYFGNGGDWNNDAPTANTGAGGGTGYTSTGYGGAGASGIVIVYWYTDI